MIRRVMDVLEQNLDSGHDPTKIARLGTTFPISWLPK